MSLVWVLACALLAAASLIAASVLDFGAGEEIALVAIMALVVGSFLGLGDAGLGD